MKSVPSGQSILGFTLRTPRRPPRRPRPLTARGVVHTGMLDILTRRASGSTSQRGESMQDRTGVTALARRRGWWRMVAAIAAVTVLVAACGSDDDDEAGDSQASDGDAASALGEPNPASGEPVKVGFVGDGQTPAIDNTSQLVVAEATVEYLNEYRAGFGGRPIELVSCETQGDQAKSLDCRDRADPERGGAGRPSRGCRPCPRSGTRCTRRGSRCSPTRRPTRGCSRTRSRPSALGNPVGSLVGVPTSVAEDNDSDKVVSVIINIPAATAIFEQQGEELFGDAGLDFELVKVPPGTADMTPQMADVSSQENVTVQIVGNDPFAIAAMQGLNATGFDGPIVCIGCDTEAAQEALGSSLDGVTVTGQARGGGPGDPDVQLFEAVMDTYAPDLVGADDLTPMASYLTWMAAHEGLDTLTGDITAESVIQTFKSMPSTEIPLYQGGQFRCNGKAEPASPAVCGNATPFATLDAEGNPTDFQVTNTDPVPD